MREDAIAENVKFTRKTQALAIAINRKAFFGLEIEHRISRNICFNNATLKYPMSCTQITSTSTIGFFVTYSMATSG